ncbi:precorrin-4 methylase [Klebsiella variicola]|nr:precorrin-4 methylase [Klebsiella variicola]
MAETFDPHCVWFVGAGPGDRELITLKGYRLLQQAQVVIYAGSLINTELLAYCPPQAECHDSAALHLEQILDLMEAGVKAGKTVVRLQTGDVSLYGSVREQGERVDPPRDPLAGGAGRQRFPRRGGRAGGGVHGA